MSAGNLMTTVKDIFSRADFVKVSTCRTPCGKMYRRPEEGQQRSDLKRHQTARVVMSSR